MTDKNLALFGGGTAAMPAHLLTSSAPLGNENLKSEDLAIPQLKVLQALSPQCGEVEGATAGKIFNTITKESVDSLFVMNLKYEREFTIFKKRNLGGGFNGNYPTLEGANAAASALPGTLADYEITETAKHLVYVLDDAGVPKHLAMLYFSKSGLEVSRNWNSSIQFNSEGRDRFSRVWRLSTVKRENNQGKWYVANIEDMGWAPEMQYNAAKEQFLAIQSKLPNQGEAA
jgi:hypothetical protein